MSMLTLSSGYRPSLHHPPPPPHRLVHSYEYSESGSSSSFSPFAIAIAIAIAIATNSLVVSSRLVLVLVAVFIAAAAALVVIFPPQYQTLPVLCTPYIMSHPEDIPTASRIPVLYRALFLYIEPFSTLAGAIQAHYRQSQYLQLTHPASAPAHGHIPLSTSIVLTQLANLYFLLCINEALVLRCTRDLKVWKTFLFGLLVADFGHLYSVRLVGSWIYWKFWQWNPMDVGSVPFVYLLAIARILFLAGVGFASPIITTTTKTKGYTYKGA